MNIGLRFKSGIQQYVFNIPPPSTTLKSPSALEKKVSDHLPVVIFKYNMDADKPVPMVNIPPVRFIYGPTKQEIIGDIQGDWDTVRLLAVVTDVDVLVEEELSDIVMNSRRYVIHLE